MKKKLVYLFLLSIFLFIFIVFFLGLNKENLYTPKEVKNKKLAIFDSNELYSNKEFNSKEIIDNNKFTLINIWSSWCVPCRSEHAILMRLSKNSDLYIIGLNYKDKKNNSIKFIEELGNPFSKILTDPDGIISISFGAYGVPETFLVNNKSEIIKKYIGPLTNENILEIKKIIN
tara:strand:- start:1066 stop:1587 length:522 start_codon:yes stop_codon:yes gene_type:complete